MLKGNCLFMPLTFSSFIGLCRSAYCNTWNFWNKNWQNVEMRYQSILVPFFRSFLFHVCLSFLNFFFFFFFEAKCLWYFFWQKIMELHALRGAKLHEQTNFIPLINQFTMQFVNEIHSYSSFRPSALAVTLHVTSWIMKKKIIIKK